MTDTTRLGAGTVPAPDDVQDLKAVPQDAALRHMVRELSRRAAARFDHGFAPRVSALEAAGRDVLAQAGLDERFLGFAMVAVDNEYWREAFEAVPYAKRLLLLPKCLRPDGRCTAPVTARGVECRVCGACGLGPIKAQAEALGYRVLIAEGTPAVVQTVLSGAWDAVLGVACLDSLEKAFRRISDLGMPHFVVPLLRDGCHDTEAEIELVADAVAASRPMVSTPPAGYVPLLRAAARLFDPASLPELLTPAMPGFAAALQDPPDTTERIAFDWLCKGGKRFRPFLTLAAYATAAHGNEALCPSGRVADGLPLAVRRLALAVEALHKASLAHDDVEDADLYRYGEDTLYRRYGTAVAINVGDCLVGLGYQLIGSVAADLGAACAADILAAVSSAHVRLCSGQGLELAWANDPAASPAPIAMLQAYALKTAPAFEAAFHMGMRAAGPGPNLPRLRLYCRHLGVAYQARNDLKDWEEDALDKMVAGQDALAARPTILRALAMDAADAKARAELDRIASAGEAQSSALTRACEIYRSLGVFERTETLIEKCRQRALAEADGIEPLALRDLLRFVVDAML